MLLYMPTKVYSEDNCVINHGKEMILGTKAMVVTGKHSSRKNGSLDDVLNVLSENNIDYIIYDDIEENPSVETIMKAKEIGCKEGVDFLIGIGGGSPLDASKSISLMMKNPLETEEVLYQPKALDWYPIVCIPTTCGTGSEVTPYSILTLHKQKTKRSTTHKVFATLALIDHKYLKSMSYNGLVNTCVDALAHLLEGHLNARSNELNRMYSKEGLSVWAKFKDALLKNDLNDIDYKNMMHASMIAGLTITHTGTSIPHAMSYPVTYELNIPHGRACGLFLPGFIEAYQNKDDVNECLNLLGFNSEGEFKDYMVQLLGIVEIHDELIDTCAQGLIENKAKLKNFPFEITKEELKELLTK